MPRTTFMVQHCERHYSRTFATVSYTHLDVYKRQVVVGRDKDMVAIASEVCGLNAIMPDRNVAEDIYPHEREMVVIDNDLAVQRWNQ